MNLPAVCSRWCVFSACWVLALLASAFVGACAPVSGAVVDQNVEKVRQERQYERLFARGRAYAQVGDLTRAEQYLSAAMDSGAEPEAVMPLLLRVCVESGRFRAGIGYAGEYLKTHPNNVPLRFLLGSMMQAVDEPDGAMEQFERVVKADPDHADAHYALAVLARDKQDLVRADHHFREYLRILPEGPFADEAKNSLLVSVP